MPYWSQNVVLQFESTQREIDNSIELTGTLAIVKCPAFMVPAADTDKRIWNEYSYLTKQPNCFEDQDQHMDACAIPGALATRMTVDYRKVDCSRLTNSMC